MKNGNSYTSTVTGQDADGFAVSTTLVNGATHIKKVGDEYQSDSPEPGKKIVSFKENLKAGDMWTNAYLVNGIQTDLTYTVREVGISKSVSGKNYQDVLLLESDAKMSMNGAPVPMKFLTQYYYAKGVGLILTTSSAGDEHALTEYTVK
jgi:hypothetical protein